MSARPHSTKAAAPRSEKNTHHGHNTRRQAKPGLPSRYPEEDMKAMVIAEYHFVLDDGAKND